MKHGTSSKTAELGAMIRSVASKNKYGKTVFYDPFSEMFIGSKTLIPYVVNRVKSVFNPKLWTNGMNSVGFLISLCRHRFFFDKLSYYTSNKIEQVVLIGAGFDTNFAILSEKLKNINYIEFDHPDTQNRKKEVLKKRFKKDHNLKMHSIDLSKDSFKTITSQIDDNKFTLILIEGVLSYLSKEKICSLLQELTELKSKFVVVADYRLEGLKQDKNKVAKSWVKSFKKEGEEYISYFYFEEMNSILTDCKYEIEEHFDLFDLWERYSNLKPQKELNNFAGIFVASCNGKK